MKTRKRCLTFCPFLSRQNHHRGSHESTLPSEAPAASMWNPNSSQCPALQWRFSRHSERHSTRPLLSVPPSTHLCSQCQATAVNNCSLLSLWNTPEISTVLSGDQAPKPFLWEAGSCQLLGMCIVPLLPRHPNPRPSVCTMWLYGTSCCFETVTKTLPKFHQLSQKLSQGKDWTVHRLASPQEAGSSTGRTHNEGLSDDRSELRTT